MRDTNLFVKHLHNPSDKKDYSLKALGGHTEEERFNVIAILACLIFNEDRQRIRVGVKLISAHILRNLLILPRAQSHDIGKTIFLAIYEPNQRS